ncbi:hypothetical protein [Intrasporangium sp.]|uniref:hypothetical protein n=1 Tax=Intrasporangium sp. TaxID=1925024 RepID=UPI00293AA5E7|nr:hypothetical protein [Intrasporangium sp.]MDV3220271.1 hypothetical protein [Intrasporangium sp.]
MIPQEPRLLPDGRVFPPVTPDPPTPPGQEEVVVPDLVIEIEAERRSGPATEPDTDSEGHSSEQTA